MAKNKILFSWNSFIYPKLNESLKWRYDYVLIVKSKPSKKKMEVLLDRFFKTMEFSMKRKFNIYIVKVSQGKESFYVLIRKPRGKILGDDLSFTIENVKYISEKIYRSFARHSSDFRYKFFPYFKLVRCYTNYQYHFLVVRKDHQF